ncbi:MAG: hydroxyacylglutathione hydrolase [Hyphomicrobiaceae bacterium]
MTTLEIHQFPCRSDNYGVLAHSAETNETASIDAPDANAVLAALEDKSWSLTHVFTTHHHNDHTEGNLALKQQTGATIFGPKAEADKIPGIDQAFGDGDAFEFAGHRVHVLDTPGHTAGHISYWLPDDNVAFVGDTLFAMGCGRLFEGTPAQMWASLQKIIALPTDTTIYCGHEYTQANAAFSLTVDPNNPTLRARAKEVEALRAAGKPTLPTKLDIELETNPFLRPDDPGIRATLNMPDAANEDVFAELRERKNNS